MATEDDNVLYVGSTNCLRRRIAYLETPAKTGLHSAGKKLAELQARLKAQGEGVVVVHYILCDNFRERERDLIRKYNPPWNVHLTMH